MKPGGLIRGQNHGMEGRLEVCRADLRPGRANLRPRWSRGGRTDIYKDGQTDGCLQISPCSKGHPPFGAAAKREKNLLSVLTDNRN